MAKKLATYRLDENLLDDLKAYSQKDQRTITAVVDMAIRAHIGVKQQSGTSSTHYDMDIPALGDS